MYCHPRHGMLRLRLVAPNFTLAQHHQKILQRCWGVMALLAAPRWPSSTRVGPSASIRSGGMSWLNGVAFSRGGGNATHNWKPRLCRPSKAEPVCHTPPPACIHSNPPCGKTPCCPFVPGCALQQHGQCGNARMRVQTEAPETVWRRIQ